MHCFGGSFVGGGADEGGGVVRWTSALHSLVADPRPEGWTVRVHFLADQVMITPMPNVNQKEVVT